MDDLISIIIPVYNVEKYLDKCLDTVIKDNHGTVYYICCLYKAEKDSDHQYMVSKYWNDCVRE